MEYAVLRLATGGEFEFMKSISPVILFIKELEANAYIHSS